MYLAVIEVACNYRQKMVSKTDGNDDSRNGSKERGLILLMILMN
jgi:hypothetical protein